jgi:hypothetical protein
MNKHFNESLVQKILDGNRNHENDHAHVAPTEEK